jgi:hypothetical protein
MAFYAFNAYLPPSFYEGAMFYGKGKRQFGLRARARAYIARAPPRKEGSLRCVMSNFVKRCRFWCLAFFCCQFFVFGKYEHECKNQKKKNI